MQGFPNVFMDEIWIQFFFNNFFLLTGINSPQYVQNYSHLAKESAASLFYFFICLGASPMVLKNHS